MSNHKEWIAAATGDSQRAVARTLGMDSGQLSREANKGLDADRVIEISYAYDLNPVISLQQTGHLRVESSGETVDTLLDRVLTLAEQAKSQLSNTAPAQVDSVTQNEYGLVADDSPDEDEMRGHNDWPDHMP